MARIDDLQEACAKAYPPFYVTRWCPGDGVARYRFFGKPGNGYFGPEDADYTALGWSEATAYATGRGAHI